MNGLDKIYSKPYQDKILTHFSHQKNSSLNPSFLFRSIISIQLKSLNMKIGPVANVPEHTKCSHAIQIHLIMCSDLLKLLVSGLVHSEIDFYWYC